MKGKKPPPGVWYIKCRKESIQWRGTLCASGQMVHSVILVEVGVVQQGRCLTGAAHHHSYLTLPPPSNTLWYLENA